MANFTPYPDDDDSMHFSTSGELIFPTKLIAPSNSIHSTSANRIAMLGEDNSLLSYETQSLIHSSRSHNHNDQTSSTPTTQYQFYSHYQTDSFTNIPSTTNETASISSGQQSPFFRPSTPQPVTVTQTMSTPNGTHILRKKREKLILRSKTRNETDKPEKKSSLLGATSNLVNTIVGAGIIGIPYAMNQTGILAGVILIIIVATLTDKSLRILIETGKHANVKSYEMLMEAVFGGRLGFVFISINMFIMSFGAMVCYLLIIRETFAHVLMQNEFFMNSLNAVGAGTMLNEKSIGRWFLIVSSFIVILPLSMQRDMANLSTTSTISVMLDILMVFIVAISSPVQESIEQSGGIDKVMKGSTIHVQTFFIGLGVLSFAFVCQDSSFIIAGSLHKPTKKRWGVVTRSSLTICTMLAIVIGVTGYLGFQDKTMGNVLLNFSALPKSEMSCFGTVPTYKAINIARILLGLTMFCVYPLASYVARHVLIVLFFSGKTAHSGDDHSVLARWDRRFILTFFLYGVALVLALLCDDLGTVLALTGAVAGSSLSYLGPGVAYLGIHGLAFLDQIGDMFMVKKTFTCLLLNHPLNLLPDSKSKSGGATLTDESGLIKSIFLSIVWYLLFMPVWCSIGFHGGTNFEKFRKLQEMKKGNSQNRVGKINHKERKEEQQEGINFPSPRDAVEDGLPLRNKPRNYGSLGKKKSSNPDAQSDFEPPKLKDFVLAVTYMIVGIVALTAGIFSITAASD